MLQSIASGLRGYTPHLRNPAIIVAGCMFFFPMPVSVARKTGIWSQLWQDYFSCIDHTVPASFASMI